MEYSYEETKAAAEADLYSFIRLVAPHRVLGMVHKELISWWTREDAQDHQLVLLPRDHGKSALVAYRCAWHITNHPDCRILYLSSTAKLAEKQLKFIKDILTSDIYRKYWPLMVHKDEGKRAKWSATEIEVDHPLRAKEGIRDATVFTGGLTTSLTGFHCDVAVLDDCVVRENAYSTEGRSTVSEQYSLISSIEEARAKEWVVGTRYHPKDLYNDMLEMVEETYDEEGDLIGSQPVYETFQKEVEDAGDGSGEFLWPRQKRDYDNKYFGFNQKILARKRAKYLDTTQFHAQYYNDPNDPEGSGIGPENFNYYKREHLSQRSGNWYLKDRKLNVFASIDFAYSLKLTADWTAIAVVGVDGFQNYYVLDIVRFKTKKISEYFKYILALHQKWGFRKLRAEVTAAQSVIVQNLKDEYITRHGLALSVIEHKPTRHTGAKVERIKAVLETRYENGQIWHYKGGNCQLLEEELNREHSAHDDMKDALASVVEIAVPPAGIMGGLGSKVKQKIQHHPRFGGIV